MISRLLTVPRATAANAPAPMATFRNIFVLANYLLVKKMKNVGDRDGVLGRKEEEIKRLKSQSHGHWKWRQGNSLACAVDGKGKRQRGGGQ